jgi:hypothetical protein
VLGLVLVTAWRVLRPPRPKAMVPPTKAVRIGEASIQPQVMVLGQSIVVLAPDGSLWEVFDRGFANPVQSNIVFRSIVGRGFDLFAFAADNSLYDNYGGGELVPAPQMEPPSMVAVSARCTYFLSATNARSPFGWVRGYGPRHDVQFAYERRWRTIAAGWELTGGIRADGSLWAWGNAPTGLVTKPVRLGNETNWVRLIGTGPGLVGRREDGSTWLVGYVPAWLPKLDPSRRGAAWSEPVRMPELDGWREVVLAEDFWGIASDGTLRIFGPTRSGDAGKLSAKEVVPDGGKQARWLALSAGEGEYAGGVLVGMTEDGWVWTWGRRRDLGALPKTPGEALRGSLSDLEWKIHTPAHVDEWLARRPKPRYTTNMVPARLVQFQAAPGEEN